MLGTEPQVVQAYVETGQAKIIFWPVLNYGDPSLLSTTTAECVARQDIDAFWELHRYLFQHQADLWSAGRDYFVGAAAAVGADPEAFAACYDEGDAQDHVLQLDAMRRERGIFSQPVFDINGQLLHGSQSFDTFAAIIDAALAADG